MHEIVCIGYVESFTHIMCYYDCLWNFVKCFLFVEAFCHDIIDAIYTRGEQKVTHNVFLLDTL